MKQLNLDFINDFEEEKQKDYLYWIPRFRKMPVPDGAIENEEMSIAHGQGRNYANHKTILNLKSALEFDKNYKEWKQLKP